MSQPKLITLTATNGQTIQFIDEIKAQGGMKDVMFSPDANASNKSQGYTANASSTKKAANTSKSSTAGPPPS